MKPITQAEYQKLPNKMLYAIAMLKDNGEHEYICGDGHPAALPKDEPGRTMLRDSAYYSAIENKKADGIGLADGDKWRFIPLKSSIVKADLADNAKTVEKDAPATPQGVLFAPYDPFTEAQAPVERFPVEALPEPFRAYCEAAGESYQVDAAMVGTCVLSVLSAVFQKCRYWVQIAPDWREPCNLFLMTTAAPSERKSPVLRDALAPLTDAISAWNERQAVIIEWEQQKIQVLKRTTENIAANLARKNSNSRSKAKVTEEDLKAAQEKLREAESEQLHPQEWLVDDTTPEALALVLRDNDEVAALLSGEGGAIMGTLAGRYSAPGSSANIDLILKGYSVEPVIIHRINREPVTLKQPRITMMLMTQPSLLSDFVANDTFCGRGLCARFMYSFPKSYVGKRSFTSKSVPQATRRAYESTVRELAQYALDWDAQDTTLTVSPDALKELQKYHDEVEPTRPEMSDMMQAWSGKAEGGIVRIAALLFLAQNHGQVGEIDLDSMRNAVLIGRYFTTMSEYALGYSQRTKAQRDAMHILNKLTSDSFDAARKAGRITQKELLDKLKSSRFGNVSSLQDGLKELERRGYIVRRTIRSGSAGRPSPTYFLNPEAF